MGMERSAWRRPLIGIALSACVAYGTSTAHGAVVDEQGAREEAALREAAAAASDVVVRIDTVGGLDQVDGVLVGSGPTSGVIVGAEGWIVTSSFAFAARPASVIVTLADGSRRGADVVATDHSRKLTLLKIATDAELPVAEPVPDEAILVGQWAVAVGRGLGGREANVSVGIVSAKDRVWGKAIQTDAKISPNNYGGALVDLAGRVMGILVPLSPARDGEVAGVEWYDSGIGFAIPLSHVLAMMPAWSEGNDLHMGRTGFGFRTMNPLVGPPVVATSRANSPAYRAGVRAGDTIVSIDGAPVARQGQVMEAVRQRYAGDVLRMQVERDERRLDMEMELVAELEAYTHPYLGMLAMRDVADGEAGVAVRAVDASGPAAEAGIVAGERITEVDGAQVNDRFELIAALAAVDAGATVQLSVAGAGGRTRSVNVTTAGLADAELSRFEAADLPSAVTTTEEAAEANAEVGRVELTVPAYDNRAVAWVPEDYDPAVAYGVVVWLPVAGTALDNAFVEAWQEACAGRQLIFLVAEAADADRWARTDVEFVSAAVEQLQGAYHVDPTRVVAAGTESGGAVALVLAFRRQAVFRGAAIVDARLPGRPPENVPEYRTSFFVGEMGDGGGGAGSETVTMLEERRFPVVTEAVTAEMETWPERFVRWVDTLDRL